MQEELQIGELAMHYPQLLVWESDGRLAAQLRKLAEDSKWSLRQPRQADACLRLLERGGPAVLVVKAGRDLESELALIEQVRWRFPDMGIVLVGDSDHVRLVGLAWDLGVSWVHLPPAPISELQDIVAGLMGVPATGSSS
jgi:hypothetical protein